MPQVLQIPTLSRCLQGFFLLLGLSVFPLSAAPMVESQSLELGEMETTLEIYRPTTARPDSATGSMRFIWWPSEVGLQAPEREQARALQAMGHEVWLLDPFAAYFLPVVQSSLDKMDGSLLAAVLAHAIAQGDKPVVLIATGRSAIPLLRGLRRWQQQEHQQQALAGVILLHPKLYVETPEPGEKAALMPIVSQTNAPLFLIQPEKSPWRWRFNETLPALQQSGSDLYVQIVKGVRDRFYFRPDAVVDEQQMARRLPQMLDDAARLLAALEYRPRQVKGTVKKIAVREGKRERQLKPYAGDTRPKPLVLSDLNAKTHRLEAYRGEVVLVNFWASWCPPCVHEMPSMQRLDRRLGKGFTILAVNMAEERPVIERFLQEKVAVDFTILMDSEGEALRQWGVFAFPTSYVIDKQGKIRYALFGAVDWERGDIVDTLKELMAE